MSHPIPTYRIFIVPERLDSAAVCTRSEAVRSLLMSPSGLRPGGFGYRGLGRTQLTPEGIEGTGMTEQEITLLENGYFELRSPLRNASFQWLKEQWGFSNGDWLYPYAVQEMPLTFLLVAKSLYKLCNVGANLRLRQEYRNVSGFVLPPGHPGNPLFAEDSKRYGGDHIVGQELTLASGFVPAQACRQLVEEVYAHFGYGTEVIPLLEELEEAPHEMTSA